jgi:uncharacterized protein YcnI
MPAPVIGGSADRDPGRGNLAQHRERLGGRTAYGQGEAAVWAGMNPAPPPYAPLLLLCGRSCTLVGGAAAQAHVRVIPESTAGGAFTKMTFRVPNESDTASTTRLMVTLPSDTPLAFVSAQHLDGWTVKIAKTKLAKPIEVEGTTLTEAASSITWTATKGHEVAPGEFQEFAISGGPLPTGAKSLAFPAVQTYSDGTVANWNEPQPEGADEPEHPVPSFDLTAALPEGADADGDAAAPAAEAAAPASAADSSAAEQSDGLARAAGFGGLLLGLLGLIFGLLAWRTAQSRPATGAVSSSKDNGKDDSKDNSTPAGSRA